MVSQRKDNLPNQKGSPMYNICFYKDGAWRTVGTLPYTCNFQAIISLTQLMDEPGEDICIEDAKTGEVYWQYSVDGYGDEPDWDEPDDFDAEMGFDPYEGCWTGDC